MFLKIILLISLIFVAVQSHENCNGRCVPYHDCPSLRRSWVVPKCDEKLVCCPRPKVPIYRTRSEIACLNYSNNRTLCPDHLLISHGTASNRNEFQYMALIGMFNVTLNETKWICGGTLIHRKFVLTAAHCIQFQRERGTKEPDFFVRLGAHSFTDGIQYSVIEKYFHPNRIIKHNTHDICILELNDSVIFNEKIKPACLPTSNVKLGEILTVSGWGGLNSSSDLPRDKQLNKASLRILDVTGCPRGQSGMHICGIGVNNQSSPCKGDSGGPLARWHPTWGSCLGQTVGIVSTSENCSGDHPRNLFTDVFTYLEWIENIVWPKN